MNQDNYSNYDEYENRDPDAENKACREDAADEQTPYDVVAGILAFEDGELAEDGVVELFQYLVDTGFAWRLPGSYGRTASNLIERGLILPAPRA